jgi:hypothetical protein
VVPKSIFLFCIFVVVVCSSDYYSMMSAIVFVYVCDVCFLLRCVFIQIIF